MLNKILFVEGSDDKYLIEQVHEKTFKIRNKFKIEAYKEEAEGIEALLKKLPIILKGAEATDVVGVVVDADTNTSGRWQRIKQIIVNAGYTNIKDSFSDGLILDTDDVLPRFGLWIMPNNEDTGMLEDFIRTLIHDDDKLQPKVESTMTSLKEEGLRLFTDAKKPKAFISTWLAWQESPGISFGSAMNKRVFVINGELCTLFTNWLSRLYSIRATDSE